MRQSTQREISQPVARQCASALRAASITRAIRQIPRGKVATYAQVAAAAGCPLNHRQVAQVLRKAGDALPWQRILGSGGQIRLGGPSALEQQVRLEMEGIHFRGKRVRLEEHQHVFHPL